MDRRCTAKAKTTGEQCAQPAILNGNVCRFHGGAAPQTVAAAERRTMETLVGPALAKLKEILNDDDTPPGVRLAACRDILDRTGMAAPRPIHVVTLSEAEDRIDQEIRKLEAEMNMEPRDFDH